MDKNPQDICKSCGTPASLLQGECTDCRGKPEDIMDLKPFWISEKRASTLFSSVSLSKLRGWKNKNKAGRELIFGDFTFFESGSFFRTAQIEHCVKAIGGLTGEPQERFLVAFNGGEVLTIRTGTISGTVAPMRCSYRTITNDNIANIKIAFDALLEVQ